MSAALDLAPSAADQKRGKVVMQMTLWMSAPPVFLGCAPASQQFGRTPLEEAEFEAPASTIELMRKLIAEKQPAR